MPYALFCNEAQLSKAYPTEAAVWKLARQSGLVVDSATEEEKADPRAAGRGKQKKASFPLFAQCPPSPADQCQYLGTSPPELAHLRAT